MKHHAIALLLCAATTVPAWAATECATTIEGNDAMQYNVSSITVPKSCKQFVVTLKHTGKLPKTAMGHNFVLGKTDDMKAIDADGIKAGLDNNYVKPGDTRVIAASKVVGGGESTEVKIPVTKLKAGTAYTYFCSFPGHAAVMKGTLSLGS